jgi:cell division protein FtsA
MRSNDCKSIVVGLDVGTAKICAVVGGLVDGRLAILGSGTSVSRGIRKGVVVQEQAAIESIREAILAAEKSSEVEINAVYLGVTGGHIKVLPGAGIVGIGGRAVTQSDVENVLDAAKNVYMPLDREILHVIPSGYSIDGRNSIMNPEGMSAGCLEAKACVLAGAVSHIKQAVHCCEEAGMQVLGIIFEPIASARSVLKESERQNGAVVVDIGGGTTDMVIYHGELMNHAGVIPVGGNHFTNDIAVVFGIPVPEAERLKKALGRISSERPDMEDIPFTDSEGRERLVPAGYLSEVLQARAGELLELVRSEMTSGALHGITSPSVVFTGGGSLLRGLSEMAEKVLGVQARIGSPAMMTGSGNDMDSPVFAAGEGLVLIGLESESAAVSSSVTPAGVFDSIFDRMRGFVAEMIIKKGVSHDV